MPRLLSALLLIPLIAACSGGPAGTASPSASRAASPGASGAIPSDAASALPSTSADASPAGPILLLACDPAGPGWPSSNLDRPADAESGTTAAAKALNEYVTGPDGADLPDTGWRELYRSKDLALYGQDDPSGEPNVLLVATISQSNGTWAGEDSSQCRPRTWLGNSLGIAADWKLSARTTKTTKLLRTLVTERACASGESAKGRLAKPKITYEADRIVITVGVKPLEGPQDCQANPATPLTITLAEALGSRTLFNGGPYPEVQVAQPK